MSQPVQHIDLLPTILDLIDAPRPDGLRGRSLRPLLEWRERPVPEQYVYSEGLYSRYHFGWSELTALTDAHVRFIRAHPERSCTTSSVTLTSVRTSPRIGLGRFRTCGWRSINC